MMLSHDKLRTLGRRILTAGGSTTISSWRSVTPQYPGDTQWFA
jgi:hypothetical protein